MCWVEGLMSYHLCTDLETEVKAQLVTELTAQTLE